MLRIKATPSFPEHFSLLSTSMRWGTTQYVLNDVFRPLNESVMAGYENWYPFDMSCSVAMYIQSGGYGLGGAPAQAVPDLLAGSPFGLLTPDDRAALWAPGAATVGPKAYSLVLTNGYGDVYRMNLLRNRENYQAYRGICSYRGFSLSGCSTTGEVVMLRINGTPSMPEYYSLVSTSMRWGTTQYFLNDVFRPLNEWVMAGYENWYPFDMSCSVAMYVHSGGFGLGAGRPEPVSACRRDAPFDAPSRREETLVGALLPLSGDLADVGAAYRAALEFALADLRAEPDMPDIRLVIEDTRTDVGTAYDKLVELRSNGCHIVLGPESSEECRILKTYANEHDVLLVSSASTAVPLALPGDNLMRLATDDSHQARALAGRLAREGLPDLFILSRSDIYGDGFLDTLLREYRARGGVVCATHYCPRASGLIPETVSNLAAQVADTCARRGADRVAVVTILFDEGVTVLEQGARHPALQAVRWYGTDGMAENQALTANPTAAAMAAHVGYTCLAPGRYTNALFGAVEARVAARLGRSAVSSYPMSCYDALWLAAGALKRTGGIQTMGQLLDALRAEAGVFEGCTGPIRFNAADDRIGGGYDVWSYRRDGAAWAPGGLGPSLTLNGAEAPAAVPRGAAVRVSLSVALPGNRLGLDADWWLAASTPAGWYYVGPDWTWHAEPDPAGWQPVYQGPLAEGRLEAGLQTAGLPPGAYVLYFGLDRLDGRLDEAVWFDDARLEVQ